MVWQNYDRKLAREPKVDAKGLRLINDGIWQKPKSDLELKLYKKRGLTRKGEQFEEKELSFEKTVWNAQSEAAQSAVKKLCYVIEL